MSLFHSLQHRAIPAQAHAVLGSVKFAQFTHQSHNLSASIGHWIHQSLSSPSGLSASTVLSVSLSLPLLLKLSCSAALPKIFQPTSTSQVLLSSTLVHRVFPCLPHLVPRECLPLLSPQGLSAHNQFPGLASPKQHINNKQSMNSPEVPQWPPCSPHSSPRLHVTG